MQEPTVYQTELVFHATRCKQIYLIRTPCSYCIQSHFLYRQKEKKKKVLAVNFYNTTKKDLNCVFPSLNWIFFFFSSYSCLNWDPKVRPPHHKDDLWAK